MTQNQIEGLRLPLIDNEEVLLSFGERGGLKDGVVRDSNKIVLTSHRVIHASKNGRTSSIAALNLDDIKLAEINHISRGIVPFLRIAILFAGAWAAMATLTHPIVSIALAAAMTITGAYQLLAHIALSKQGSITLRAGPDIVVLFYSGNKTNDAHIFVKRFFEAKASYSDQLSPLTKSAATQPEVSESQFTAPSDQGSTDTETLIPEHESRYVDSSAELPQTRVSGAPGEFSESESNKPE